jgi:hypothetical protein
MTLDSDLHNLIIMIIIIIIIIVIETEKKKQSVDKSTNLEPGGPKPATYFLCHPSLSVPEFP